MPRSYWTIACLTPAFVGATTCISDASEVPSTDLLPESVSPQSEFPSHQRLNEPIQQTHAVAGNEVVEHDRVIFSEASRLTIAATTPSAEASAPSASSQPLENAEADSLDQATSVSQLENAEADSLDQVTSVSQLSDVKPTDWAFQALQSLVERYGCIAGYPDRTFRGNRALTRYEFAAGVNACLDRVNELIAAGTADFARKEDLEALRKLQDEFAAELATLRGRVDGLDARTATLEKQQFSTTTKLTGEAIFAIADTFGAAVGRDSDQTQPIFSDRVRLGFDTSFTGNDILRTRLQARNTPNFQATTGTNMTRLGFDGDEGNVVQIEKLYYRFPVGDKLKIQVDATTADVFDALISTLSPFESSGNGSVSRFGRFNPIYRLNNAGQTAGVTFAYKFSDSLRLEGGYTGDRNSNNPSAKNGLFNGGYLAMGQLVFTPGNLTVGLTYAHSYYPGNDVNITSNTGSAFAAQPFGSFATSADSVGATLQYKFSPQFILGSWFGASFANQEAGGNDNATILNGAIYAAFPDLGKKGNLGGLLVGVPPKVVSNSNGDREDPATSVHVEAFYRYRLNDNIAITPGVFVIFNPEHNDNNDTQVVGVVRTTFSF